MGTPISDFIVSVGEHGRKFEKKAQKLTKSAARKVRKASSRADDRIEEFVTNPKVDAFLTNAEKNVTKTYEKASQKVQKVFSDSESIDDGKAPQNDAQGFSEGNGEEADGSAGSSYDRDEDLKRDDGFWKSQLEELGDDTKEVVARILDGGEERKPLIAGDSDTPEEILEHIDRTNDDGAVSLVIVHGDRRKDLDAIAKLAKDSGREPVLVLSTWKRRLKDGGTSLDRAKRDIPLFLNGFRNYDPREHRPSLITVDARPGLDDKLVSLLNELVGALKGERFGIVVLTDDERADQLRLS